VEQKMYQMKKSGAKLCIKCKKSGAKFVSNVKKSGNILATPFLHLLTFEMPIYIS
jgi:hypothetical protein